MLRFDEWYKLGYTTVAFLRFYSLFLIEKKSWVFYWIDAVHSQHNKLNTLDPFSQMTEKAFTCDKCNIWDVRAECVEHEFYSLRKVCGTAFYFSLEILKE